MAEQKTQYTKQELSKAVEAEYIKCASNPIYFLKKYAIIQHPIRGKIPFHLFDYQESTLIKFLEFDYNVVLKARQLGLSTLVAGYALWMMTFFDDKNILVIATKQDVAKNLVTKVRVMNSNLPDWLRQECTEDNKLSLAYKNGSQIKAISSGEDAGRSEALSLLILDEAAFIDKIDEIWGASSATLATGGKAIVLSTPNGVGNFFHKTYIGAIEKKNEFNPTKLKWNVHPERDQAWRDRQDTISGVTMAAQENDCDFLKSGKTVIEAMILDEYRKSNQIMDPVEYRGIDRNYHIYKYPEPNKEYLIAADVGRGDAEDYSAFHVFDIDTIEQVAEYQGKIGTKDYGNLCVVAGTDYNNALLVIENNNIGWAAIQQVIDRGYDNLFYMSKDMQYVDVHRQVSNKYRSEDKRMIPGFGVSGRTRPLIIAKMDQYFRERGVIIHSRRLLEELFVFIYKNGRPEAMQGYNDDLVISLAIGLWIRDTALRLRSEGILLQASTLENISMASTVLYTAGNNPVDPYKQKVNDKETIDLTEYL